MSGDADGKIKVYISTTSGSHSTQANQKKIEQVLTAKKVNFVMIDTADPEKPENKLEMRRIMNDDTGLAPQICNGETYCGNFEGFSEANECGELEQFLRLKPAEES